MSRQLSAEAMQLYYRKPRQEKQLEPVIYLFRQHCHGLHRTEVTQPSVQRHHRSLRGRVEAIRMFKPWCLYQLVRDLPESLLLSKLAEKQTKRETNDRAT